MSFDWSRGARAQPGSYLGPLMAARDALGLAFAELDLAQRSAATNVRAYKRLLPDRAAKTGLVARFDVLDTASNEAMQTYLDLLDQHDPISEIREMYWPAATRTLQDHERVMRDLAVKMDALQNDYAREFERIGSAVRDIRQQMAAATRAVARAEEARAALAASGYELRAVDVPLAKARLALRAITQNKVGLTTANVEQASSHVCALAEQAAELAAELPLRISRLSARHTSLTTRLGAIRHAATQMPDQMSVLRREFSTDNFADLQARETTLAALAARTTDQLNQLGASIEQCDWDQALTDVAEVAEAFDEVEAFVTAPRERLEVLRRAKRDPDEVLSRLRFVAKDARYLLTGKSGQAAEPWAARFDACVGQIDILAERLERGHPDYWGVLRQAGELQRRIDEIIEDFRTSYRKA